MNYVICPDSLRFAKENMNTFGISVLFNITDLNNPKKICCDVNDYIINNYKEVISEDKNAMLTTWLKILVDNNKVKYLKTTNSDSDEFIDVTKKVFEKVLSYRTFITTNADYMEKIKTLDVSFVSPEDAINLFNTSYLTTFSYDNLIEDTVKALEEMAVKQREQKVENLHNDILVSKLRNKDCYIIDEQAREGQSSGGSTGELDFVIKDCSNRRKSIFEALRSKSCDENLAIHFNKLINRYDVLGLKVNFIIVYVENKNFENYCNNYNEFMRNINSHSKFENHKCELKNYIEPGELDLTTPTDVRIAKSIMSRNGIDIEVIHIISNFSVSKYNKVKQS